MTGYFSSFRETGFSSKQTSALFSLAFFSYGFVELLTHDSALSGVEDIFENTDYSTGWISLMVNLPYVLTIVGLQHLHNSIKTVYKMWFSCVVAILGSAGVGFLPLIPLRIASVCLIGTACACLRGTIMNISPKYPEDKMFMFVLGASCARISSPFIYEVGSSYLCIKPPLVFLAISLSAFVYPLYFHLLLDKNPHQIIDNDPDVLLIPSNKLGLKNGDGDDEDKDDGDGRRKEYQYEKIPWRVQLSLIHKSRFLLYSNFMVYVLLTFSLQCLFTTLAFKNSPFQPRQHYQYYLMAVWIGDFVGTNIWYLGKYCGRIIALFSLKTDMKACILIVISLCEYAVLFVAVWYRNIENVWAILVLAFITGVVAGMTLTLSMLSLVTEKKNEIAYIRTVLTAIHGGGCVMAAIAAIVLEPLVRQRCFDVERTSQYCIARYIGIGAKPCYRTG